MNDSLPMITATEVANYVVCPEAWRLKRGGLTLEKQADARAQQGSKLRREWIGHHDVSIQLRRHAKIAYLLLLLLVIVVFLLERRRTIERYVPTPFPTTQSVGRAT